MTQLTEILINALGSIITGFINSLVIPLFEAIAAALCLGT